MKAQTRYGALGVDVDKTGIGAFSEATSGVYKHAFCDIYPDPDMPGYGYVHHTDGAGTKPVQNYLNWKVTGKLDCFRGIAQDVLAMNTGDAFCVGVPVSASFVDYTAVNPFHVPKEQVLDILAKEWKALLEMLEGFGIKIQFSGGETADLADQLRTLDVSGAIHARYKLDFVITGERIRPGDGIVGLSSGGQARYEKSPAGEVMSNGLTLLRHCLMMPYFEAVYPEIAEPGVEYYGRFSPTDRMSALGGASVGEVLTRPTRLFAPVFKGIIDTFGKAVHGLVYNTGGGLTKGLRIGPHARYVKHSLPKPPAIFQLAQEQGNVPWKEMFKDFNMGVGAEVITDPAAADEVTQFSMEKFGIDAWEIGECTMPSNQYRLRIESPFGNFSYKKE